MREGNFKIFWVFILVLGTTFFYSHFSSARNVSEDLVVRKNLFSPDRSYSPELETKEISGSDGGDKNIERLRKNIILRGTYCYEQKCWALLELKPTVKKLLEIKTLPKDRTFKVEEGGLLGACSIKKIRRGEVILGAKCEGLVITLAESPERKKPVPPPVSSQQSSSQGQPTKRAQNKTKFSEPTPLKEPFGPSKRASGTSPSKISPPIQRLPSVKKQAPSENRRTSPQSNPFLELLKRIQKERSGKGSPTPPFPFGKPPSRN